MGKTKLDKLNPLTLRAWYIPARELIDQQTLIDKNITLRELMPGYTTDQMFFVSLAIGLKYNDGDEIFTGDRLAALDDDGETFKGFVQLEAGEFVLVTPIEKIPLMTLRGYRKLGTMFQ